MAFQAGAFQADAYQIPQLAAQPSGGFLGIEAAYIGRKRRVEQLQERIESLPEPVREAVTEMVSSDVPEPDRRNVLASKVQAENKFLRLYLAILNDYMDAVMAERERSQADNDLAIIMLLSY